jgi:hypothetical protein
MITVTEAQKKLNAKLVPKKRFRLLEETIRKLPAKEIPKPPKYEFSLKGGIGLFVKEINTQYVVVWVGDFNKAEIRFVVDTCKALGFNPTW